mmetsp:Transcript_5574/g.23678  ORF Transcript_5574/g.23678 Transcript_5574/m.23678 type:complete len:400 (-) Transcript_5574:740-1939(-)
MRLLGRGGAVHAWGAVRSNRLGFGSLTLWSTANSNQPHKVDCPPDAVQVSAGSGHSAILTSRGEVWTFGQGDKGQLGHGDFKDLSSPKKVEALPPCQWLSAGSDHTLVVSKEGFVFGFGNCTYGQLGLGTRAFRVGAPKLLTAFQDLGERISKVTAGYRVSAAITDNGKLYTFGCKNYNSLGHDEQPAMVLFDYLRIGARGAQTVPKLVTALRNQPVEDIHFGTAHALAVLRDKRIYGWGTGAGYVFGDGTQNPRLKPKECVELNQYGVQKIAVGSAHAVGVTRTGSVIHWGYKEHINSFGNTFGETSAHMPQHPSAVYWFTENKHHFGDIVGLGAGLHFSVAIGEKGTVAWGWNSKGQLGEGTVANSAEPVYVGRHRLSSPKLQMVSCGTMHSLAIER